MTNLASMPFTAFRRAFLPQHPDLRTFPHHSHNILLANDLLLLPLLAPSPRVLAYLIRRGCIPPSKLAVVPFDYLHLTEGQPEMPKLPPEVVTTPCDPWPRPYYLEDGLRKVVPYHYTYNTNCKERWRGRELLDIFASEFRDRPMEYYVKRLTQNFLVESY
jgi:tRNA pseudouridine synthase 9